MSPLPTARVVHIDTLWQLFAHMASATYACDALSHLGMFAKDIEAQLQLCGRFQVCPAALGVAPQRPKSKRSSKGFTHIVHAGALVFSDVGRNMAQAHWLHGDVVVLQEHTGMR